MKWVITVDEGEENWCAGPEAVQPESFAASRRVSASCWRTSTSLYYLHVNLHSLRLRELHKYILRRFN